MYYAIVRQDDWIKYAPIAMGAISIRKHVRAHDDYVVAAFQTDRALRSFLRRHAFASRYVPKQGDGL